MCCGQDMVGGVGQFIVFGLIIKNCGRVDMILKG